MAFLYDISRKIGQAHFVLRVGISLFGGPRVAVESADRVDFDAQSLLVAGPERI